MLEDIKNIIKQSSIYGLSRISVKIVGFILLPLYSAHFSVAEYGVIVRIETLWQILWAVYLFGLESGVVRWYTQIENKDRKNKFLFTVLLFLFVSNLVYTVILYCTSGFLSEFIFKTHNYTNLVFFASLIASLEAMIFIVLLLLRINEKALIYSIFTILNTLINLGIQYYYIVYTSNKMDGIFIAKIISPAIIILLLQPYFIGYLKAGLEINLLKELLRYSFPLMLGTLILTLLNQSDRYVLGYLRDAIAPSEVGLYGLAYNICGLINFFIISPFALAFTVLSWKKLTDENASRYYTKTITYLFFAVLYFSIFISLFTPHFIKILNNSNYWAAKDIVPWIALSMPFYAIQTVGIFSFYVTKKTEYILYFYIIALSCNVTLNFLFIPYINVYGAAFSNFISFFLLNVITYLFSKKQYFFKYEWLKIILMTTCAVIVIFPFFYFQIESRIMQIVLKLAALILFPFLLYIFKFYEPIEIQTIKVYIKKFLKLS